jgi:transcriptional regulator with XRE-family HTH domain
LIGVAFQQAHKYERGISRISAGRLYRIATALEAPIAYFFEGDEHDGSARDSSEPEGIRANGD